MPKRQGEAARGDDAQKVTKSALVSVRLDPRLRYLAELSARKHRRTLSSFIEWAVSEAVKAISLGEPLRDPFLEHDASRLWASDEGERLVRLAICYPDLLNYDEQWVWQLLRSSCLLAPAERRKSDATSEWDWTELENRVFPILRDEWPNLKRAAAGFRPDQLAWIERARLRVASGQIYPDIASFDTYDEILTLAKFDPKGSESGGLRKSVRKKKR